MCKTSTPHKDNLVSLLSYLATASHRFLSQVSLWSDSLLHCDVSHPSLHIAMGLYVPNYDPSSLHLVSTFPFSQGSIKLYNIDCLLGNKASFSAMLNKQYLGRIMKNKKNAEPASYASFERGRGEEKKQAEHPPPPRHVWEAQTLTLLSVTEERFYVEDKSRRSVTYAFFFV